MGKVWQRFLNWLGTLPACVWLKKQPPEILTGVGFGVLLILLLQAGALQSVEYAMYDLRFQVKPRVAQSAQISVMEIDDDSLKYVGRWPWRRSVYAEALDEMRKLDARMVVFDVEFTEPSARVLSQEDMVEFPKRVRAELDALRDELARFRGGLDRVGLAGARQILADFEKSIAVRRDAIIARIAQVGQNDDLAFALAVTRNGRVILPVRCYPAENQETPEHDYVLKQYGIGPERKAADAPGGIHDKWIDIPASPLHRSARRLAFTNVDTDEDGTRRRIALFREWRGRLFPQLAFATLLAPASGSGGGIALSNVEFVPGSHCLLKGIVLPGATEARDIRIPVDARGQMLIDWAGVWTESFSRFSFADLFEYIKVKEAVQELFAGVDRDYFEEQGGLVPVVKRLAQLADRRRAGKTIGETELAEIRALEERAYTIGTNEFGVMQQSLADMKKELPGLAGKDARARAAEIAVLATSISNIGKSVTLYEKLRQRVAARIGGATVIIGQTASSTTDLGATPLGINQPQVFLHANMLNTILQQSFIETMPAFFEWFALLLLPAAFGLVSRRLRPSRIILAGLGFIVVYGAFNYALFAAGLWMQFAPVTLALFLTFISITGVHYIKGDKEKKYIKNAFSHYLSSDVIDVLVKDPSALKLGGERKILTAYFSDVQGFSTISENLTPEALVDLLNAYLTDMTDIVFAHQGTVDKFEGDAIIAFYGAPVYYPDHALRACRAALVMQERIAEMRPVWKKKYGHELFVRMGINTGPMVVGNMGSRNRFDYTMMGDSVNLAARLEGVNKYYKTFTMASEFTVKELGDDIVTRELDILRVVGKTEPVRVYELVAEAGKLSDEKAEVLALFAEGLEAYRKKNWATALRHFKKVLDLDPDDGPAQVYRDRATDFKKKAPPASWDGVYTLKGK